MKIAVCQGEAIGGRQTRVWDRSTISLSNLTSITLQSQLQSHFKQTSNYFEVIYIHTFLCIYEGKIQRYNKIIIFLSKYWYLIFPLHLYRIVPIK